MTRTALEIVQAHYAAGARGDVPGMIADFSQDIEWVECAGSAYAGTFHGIPAVMQNLFSRINEEWEAFGAIPEFMVADESQGRVCVVGTYVGKFRLTGKVQNVRMVHVWTVRNEQITEFEQIVDSAAQFVVMS
jgi:ketosteroid isomerase-like protein